MFQFFDAIGNIITTVVDYVIGIFELLFNLVRLVFKAQLFLINIIQQLPPFLVVFFLVFISLAILFQILNKGS